MAVGPFWDRDSWLQNAVSSLPEELVAAVCCGSAFKSNPERGILQEGVRGLGHLTGFHIFSSFELK